VHARGENGLVLKQDYRHWMNLPNYEKCLCKKSIPSYQQTDNFGWQRTISEHDREAPPYLHRTTYETTNLLKPSVFFYVPPGLTFKIST
jgi:hypothetical protein